MRTKVHEKFLYQIWKNKNFTDKLETIAGDKIEIIDPGVLNDDKAGPDFSRARISIGGKTYVGDVEIDFSFTDWRNHGHNMNKRYNKVVLHVVAEVAGKPKFVLTEEGRKIPSVSIFDFIESGIRTSLQNAIITESRNRIFSIPCLDLNELVNSEEKLDFLLNLGLDRISRKCKRKADRLKELSYLKTLSLKEPVIKYELGEDFYQKSFNSEDFTDPELWQQLIQESIFEALGFTHNKDAMKNLAKLVDVKFLKSITASRKNFVEYSEAAFFVVSGLIPGDGCKDEEGLEYIKKSLKKWDEIKGIYSSKIMKHHQWHLMKIRPQNFPSVRISGGVRLMNEILNKNLIEKIIKMIINEDDLKKLHKDLVQMFMVKARGFWSTRYVIETPTLDSREYFVGGERANDILVNEIYPILMIYFEMFGNDVAAKKIQRIFVNIPNRTEIRIASQISKSLHLNDAWKKSIVQQGMLDLYRFYCTRQRCTECKIGSHFFS
jgi:hypothetical protein